MLAQRVSKVTGKMCITMLNGCKRMFYNPVQWDEYTRVKPAFRADADELSLQLSALKSFLLSHPPKKILAAANFDRHSEEPSGVIIFEKAAHSESTLPLREVLCGIDWLLQIYCYQTGRADVAVLALQSLATLCVPWLVSSLAALQSSEAADSVTLVDHSARLIANLSGRAASGEIRRLWEFDTAQGKVSVSVRETSFASSDLGCQTWGSGEALAHMLARGFIEFNLEFSQVLELGSGTGLGGLIAAQLLSKSAAAVSKIYLTDFQRTIVANLQRNVYENGLQQVAGVEHLDWNYPEQSLLAGRQFDVILGADLIYDMTHASTVPQVVEKFLGHKSHCRLFLLIPRRAKYQLEVAEFLENMRRAKLLLLSSVDFVGPLGWMEDCALAEAQLCSDELTYTFQVYGRPFTS